MTMAAVMEPPAVMPVADARPLVLVGVDGVLNDRWFTCNAPYCACHPTWVRRTILTRYTITINPAHGPWLLKLADETGAELAWATRWGNQANELLAPLLGLPLLPVAPTVDERPKAETVVPWTAGRPFAWIDDDETGLDLALAAHLATAPFLGIRVDGKTGLTQVSVQQARRFLDSL